MNPQRIIAEILGNNDFIHNEDPINDLDFSELTQEKRLKLAKRFVELVGGSDIARDLIDKVEECSECLDLISDDAIEADETNAIEGIANMVPSNIDYPTAVTRQMNMSPQFNASSPF